MSQSSRQDVAPVTELPDPGAAAVRGMDRLLRRRLLRLLGGLSDCQLTVVDGGERFHLGTPAASATDTLRATVTVRHPMFWRQVALGGSVGAAEAWMDGHWTAEDPVTLVRMLVRNRDLLDAMETGTARLATTLLKGLHALRRNTRSGSRRNIAGHYDLGNELFRLFLDDNLMYSSAVYADPADTLEQAQTRRLDMICRKLELGPDDHVVEIGTGWGGFALHAAARYGCRVTTTTISREQHQLASERVREAGLEDRITLLLSDYRDLDGTYDKLVSIEMIEAIGHQYLDTYFAKVASLLKPEGMALIQAITIEDHRYAKALRDVDFIKRHIFPGSFIPAVSAMTSSMARASDLRLFHLEDIGPSYALTLREWRRRFLARLEEVRALGYSERFIRMWDFYFAYCEGGFLERSIGNVHMLLTRPRCRRESILSS